jgi:hypothetical protein
MPTALAAPSRASVPGLTTLSSRSWIPRQIDPPEWTSGVFEGRPLVEALRRRDMTTVFRYLRTRGWSHAAIAAATGLSENRVRAVLRGSKVMSYDVLARIDEGLRIERGLLGMAYAGHNDGHRQPAHSSPLPGPPGPTATP